MSIKSKKQVTLLWAIPASGKTHYANEQISGPPRLRTTCIVDCDRISKYHKDRMYDAVADEVVGHLHYHEHVIIDGLIATNEVANNIFTAIVTHPGNENKYDIEFSIIWWKRDVESCKHNDRGRRHVNSLITIDNIAFEVPSRELIKEWNMAKRVTKKVVVRKPDWQVWSEENGFGCDGKMKSDTWSLGGTSGNCWNNEKTRISGEAPPVSFGDLDDLLEKICPDLPFLRYKKIFNEVVDTDTKGEADYYGGYVEYAFYVCDVPKLYGILKEMGVI